MIELCKYKFVRVLCIIMGILHLKNQFVRILGLCALLTLVACSNSINNNVVGILINSAKVTLNAHRKFILQEFSGLAQPQRDLFNQALSTLQKQTIFCLLIGINNRKEIANTLSLNTGTHISENQIKNELQVLYHSFKCSSVSQLVNLVLIGQIPFEIPVNTLPPGNYLI